MRPEIVCPLGIAIMQGYLMAMCHFPGAPAHSKVSFSNKSLIEGTVVSYSCERGFELLGPARRVCDSDGEWTPNGIPFCVINVAAGKAPMQISTDNGGFPQRALDGSTSSAFNTNTCTLTKTERVPWWYVNLLEPYMVQLVRLDFGKSCCGSNKPARVVVRVGNNRPEIGTNPICNSYTGFIKEGQPLFLPCNPPMPGAFVSVHLESHMPTQLSICEAFVYTDQALPIERCPQFRDQPPGSTATYNGKCYTFYDSEPATFADALESCRSRDGTLVDESNPALQGFISWELWKRHRSESNSQYWMGAMRGRSSELEDQNQWKWINGQDVTISFWNGSGGSGDCARFDGSKGWLWAETDCKTELNYICQHQPNACGKPEQPPNSTMVADSFAVGGYVQYSCNEGHLLVGPAIRTCLETGFYDGFPPVCKRIECGLPARIHNGNYKLINDTVTYLSQVQYECEPGYEMVGRSRLVCDIDERWNGPPPRCDVIHCEDPPEIENGFVIVPRNVSTFGAFAEYTCKFGYKLVGAKNITCLSSGLWDEQSPRCQLIECERPPHITNGFVNVLQNSITTGAVAEYSCSQGHKLIGARKINCLSSGLWDKVPPRCQSREPSTTSTITRTTTVTPKRTTTAVVHKTTQQIKVTLSDPQPSPTNHISHIIVASNGGQEHNTFNSNIDNANKSVLDKPVSVDSNRTLPHINLQLAVSFGLIGVMVLLIPLIATIIYVLKCKGQKKCYYDPPECSAAELESASSTSRNGLYVEAWEELHKAAGNHNRSHKPPKDLRRHHHHHHRRNGRIHHTSSPGNTHIRMMEL